MHTHQHTPTRTQRRISKTVSFLISMNGTNQTTQQQQHHQRKKMHSHSFNELNYLSICCQATTRSRRSLAEELTAYAMDCKLQFHSTTKVVNSASTSMAKMASKNRNHIHIYGDSIRIEFPIQVEVKIISTNDRMPSTRFSVFLLHLLVWLLWSSEREIVSPRSVRIKGAKSIDFNCFLSLNCFQRGLFRVRGCSKRMTCVWFRT